MTFFFNKKKKEKKIDHKFLVGPHPIGLAPTGPVTHQWDPLARPALTVTNVVSSFDVKQKIDLETVAQRA